MKSGSAFSLPSSRNLLGVVTHSTKKQAVWRLELEKQNQQKEQLLPCGTTSRPLIRETPRDENESVLNLIPRYAVKEEGSSFSPIEPDVPMYRMLYLPDHENRQLAIPDQIFGKVKYTILFSGPTLAGSQCFHLLAYSTLCRFRF